MPSGAALQGEAAAWASSIASPFGDHGIMAKRSLRPRMAR